MRLPTAEEADDPMRFELVGSYDAATGAIDAQGTLSGCHSWLTPFTSDDFGQIDAFANIAIMIRQPLLTLHAVVAPSVEDSQIIGTDIAAGLALGRAPGSRRGGRHRLHDRVVAPRRGRSCQRARHRVPAGDHHRAHLDAGAHARRLRDLTGDLQLTQSDVIKLHSCSGR